SNGFETKGAKLSTNMAGSNERAALLAKGNGSGFATERVAIFQAGTGATANMIEMQDASGNAEGFFNTVGNQLTLGNNTATGTSAGSLRLTDGTADGFYATLNV